MWEIVYSTRFKKDLITTEMKYHHFTYLHLIFVICFLLFETNCFAQSDMLWRVGGQSGIGSLK